MIIGASKGLREASNGESSVTIDDSVNITTSPSNYIYLNQLSAFSMVDEMEEAATPHSPCSYGSAAWTTNAQVICQLERLAPLDTKFFDSPIDYICWM